MKIFSANLNEVLIKRICKVNLFLLYCADIIFISFICRKI
jgi:hypothetical protein